MFSLWGIAGALLLIALLLVIQINPQRRRKRADRFRNVYVFNKERLAAAVTSLQRKEISTAQFSQTCAELRALVRKLSLEDKQYDKQEAYDLFNLAGELEEASSYDPQDLFFLSHAAALLQSGAPRMQLDANRKMAEAKDWVALRRRRLPIEEGLSEVRCKACGFEHPEAHFNGFEDLTSAFCGSCQKILFIEIHGERWKQIKAQEKGQGSLDGLLPPCDCGGAFLFSMPGTCPKCGGKDLETKKASRYEWFEKGRYKML